MVRMPLFVVAAAASALAATAVVVAVAVSGPEPTRVADPPPSRSEQEAAWRQQALDDLAERTAREAERRSQQQAVDDATG